MKKALCEGGVHRGRWAVSLCFAAAILLSLEALHPGACAWMGLDDVQSFNLSAGLATLSMFLGTFVLTRLIGMSSISK